jgi:methylphosphotriester-DNA--protein-cysteine methyltransferase
MTDTQDGDLSQGLDPAQYEALKKEFDDVILTMGADKNFAPYKLEYEKLYRSLKTSYESEKRLVKRCKELQDTIVQNATKVKAAIKLTQEDSNTIAVLKKEVDKAWKLVEIAKEKVDKARKLIQDLKSEIAHLHKIVEQGSGLAISQDNTV